MAKEASNPYGSYGSVSDVSAQGGGASEAGFRASAQQMGGGTAEALEHLGDTGQHVAEEQMDMATHYAQMASEAHVNDIIANQFAPAAAQLKAQAYTKKGRDAVMYEPQYQASLNEMRNGFLNREDISPYGKQLLGNYMKQHAAQESDGYERYAFNQQELYENQSYEAFKGTLSDNAVSNYNNPEAVDNTFSQMNGLIEKHAIDRGVDPTTPEGRAIITQQQRSARGDTVATMINRAMTDGDNAAAVNLYDANKDQISGKHRDAISSMMRGEFRRQEAETLQTARMDAASGQPFNEEAVRNSMQNTGRSKDYINAEINRLNNVQEQFGAADKRYTIEKQLKNDTALAFDGKAIQGSYDEAQIRAAYPKNPEKVKDIMAEVNDLHTVAGFVGSFPTSSIDEITDNLHKLKPATQSKLDADTAANYVIEHFEGRKLVDDANGRAIYGINEGANPDLFADGKIPTQQQAVARYKEKYWTAIGADNLPENMKLAAFDTAVNFGVGKAKEMIAASGNDPQKLVQLREQEHERLATENPDKYGQYAENWKKRDEAIGAANAGNNDYARQSHLYGMMEKAANTYLKSLYDDPAGTLTKNDQNLSNLLATGMKDPTKLNTYIDASLARQEAVGLASDSQYALPTNIATQLADNITDNPQMAPKMLNKLAEVTGDHWPQVYKSLVAQGELPSYYQSVAQLGSDPTTERDATLLARWAGDEKHQGKADADLLGEKTVSDMRKNIIADPNVVSLTTSLYRSGASKQQVDSVVRSIQSLAFAKQFYDKDPNAAQAAIDSFTKKYEFMPNGGARVPADKFDAISQGAETVLGTLDKNAVTPQIYQTGRSGMVKPEDYYAWVKNSPTWVTSPNGDAIWLKDPMDRLVRDKSGKPISVRFDGVNVPKREAPASTKLDFEATGGL